ncbi:polynucleotide adenylyltransferase [Halomonas sp. 18H]|uniref:polynucleotide adenylyltransferase n=1 Tax=Halomonas almeriensis TaxID=308163 RepID=UPI00222E419F|nr:MULTISPECIES: polynucleotide adenylyltransferase [Halomonas]MCW4149435.1 polynucleotide adenylyltransferase [Halomonas sp. 18H]MDN3553619.1 polynucleotide adenylyltransferase [Halomonas almeriensis]
MADRCLAGLEVYRVGGAVRDDLLGKPVTDVDWVVVGATPEEMLARGFKPVGTDFPVFLHPDSHEEYALARTERKSGHGYTGFEVHASPSVTLEEDLERRDLTINAMARAADGTLVDPFGGQADLAARLLRHVSPAFIEDPLRVLRVARFMARYAGRGFVVADDTLALMRRLVDSGELDHLAAERVWVETAKALAEPWPERYFAALQACGALDALMPELGSSLEDDLSRLHQLPEDVEADEVVAWRWARLVEPLDSPARRRLAERFKLPGRVSRLAEQVGATRRLVQAPGALDGRRIMDWFERIDAWRRRDAVAPLVALVSLEAPERAEELALAWRLATQVLPQTLVDEGYKGRALGDELRRRRHRAIDAALGHARG